MRLGLERWRHLGMAGTKAANDKSDRETRLESIKQDFDQIPINLIAD